MRFVKSFVSTFLVLFFLASWANAQQGSAKTSPRSSNSNASVCLAYEPNTVSLSGQLLRKTFANASKKKETVWIIKLAAPICVSDDAAENEFNVRQSSVKEVQLVVETEKYQKYRALLNKQIEADGTLFGAHTQHHFTKVLLMVGEIKSQ